MAKDEIAIMLLCVVLGFCIGGIVFNHDKNIKQEAIQHGYAEYNQTNGNWQWKETGK